MSRQGRMPKRAAWRRRPVRRAWQQVVRWADRGSVVWGARAVAILLGAGMAMALSGFVRIGCSLFGPFARTEWMVIGTLFAWGAVGPWAARRAAMALVRMWAATVRGATARSSTSPEDRQTEQGLVWLLQSMLGVALGTALLLGLLSAAGVRHIWPSIRDAFLWTPTTEAVSLGLLTTAMVGLPGMIAGLQLAALYVAVPSIAVGPPESVAAVGRRSGRKAAKAGERGRRAQSRSGRSRPVTSGTPCGAVRRPYISAYLLAGAALGLAVCAAVNPPGPSADKWVLAASVCMFGASAASVQIARWADRESPCPAASMHLQPATESVEAANAGSRGLILASVFAWGMSAGLWLSPRWPAEDPMTRSFFGAGVIPAAMAAGALLAGWPGRRCADSMGGLGLAFWAAGLAVMASVVVGAEAGPWRTDGIAVVAAVALGHVLSHGRHAWLRRAASERHGSAQWVGATLGGVAAGRWIRTGFDASAGSDAAAGAAACLLLLIAGGLLFIHERGAARRTRYLRIGVGFASLGAAVLLLPGAARRAASGINQAVLPFGGGVSPSRRAETFVRELGLAAPGARLAGIGGDGPTVCPNAWQVDWAPWYALSPVRLADAIGAAVGVVGPPRVWPSAEHWWRAGRDRYDLIVQMADGLRPADLPARLSWEWLEGTRRRLLAPGAILVVLPLPWLDGPAVEAIEATFALACDGLECWRVVVDPHDRTEVCLLAISPSATHAGVLREGVRPLASGERASLRRLTGERGAVIHSIRAPAFRALSDPRYWDAAAVMRLSTGELP